MPSCLRRFMSGCVEDSFINNPDPFLDQYFNNLIPDSPEANAYVNSGEQSTIAWSYAYARHIKVNSQLPFIRGFDGMGLDIWEKLRFSEGDKMGFHAGIGQLRHGGMLDHKSNFPNLILWVQR